MPEDGRMENAGEGGGEGGALHLSFGPPLMPDEVGEAAHELTDSKRDLVKIEGSFQKEGSGKDTAKQKQPHDRAPLLHIGDHGAAFKLRAQGEARFGAGARGVGFREKSSCRSGLGWT